MKVTVSVRHEFLFKHATIGSKNVKLCDYNMFSQKATR